jgi:hypothetical protein
VVRVFFRFMHLSSLDASAPRAASEQCVLTHMR